MLPSTRYGWEPPATRDTRELLAAAMAQATRDPAFGLPAWARSLPEKGLEGRRIVILGFNEFSSAFFKAYGSDGTIANHVADDRIHLPWAKNVECISSDHFVDRYRGRKDIIAINCARWDLGQRHFEAISLQAGVDSLNAEQAHRALRPKGLDYRLADWLPAFVEHAPRYAQLEERMGDELSRETMRRVMLYHLTTNKEYYRHIERPYETLYFRSGLFEVTTEEQFVDCGASLGESISGLLGIAGYDCKRAWLFEPDKFNGEKLTRLLQRFARLPSGCASRISLHPVAVGEAPDRMRFAHYGGHGGSVLPGSTESNAAVQDMVDIVRIDDVVDGAPTLLKMDIEGSELAALKGAANVIKTHKPRLAISAYHRATDLIDLSDFVLSLRPDYKVGLRHHTPVRWDTCLYFY